MQNRLNTGKRRFVGCGESANRIDLVRFKTMRFPLVTASYKAMPGIFEGGHEDHEVRKRFLCLKRLRLSAFARDITRLTGARSASYQKLRVLRITKVQNLPGLRKFSETPRAKHVLSLIEGRAKDAKFGILFLFFAAFAFFARDLPRLNGARSAPYQKPSWPSCFRRESDFSHFWLPLRRPRFFVVNRVVD